MLQTRFIQNKNVLPSLAGGALLALSANAHAVLGVLPDTILTFDFDGQFALYDSTGAVVPNDTPAVSGTILLDAYTLGGTAAMGGDFWTLPWTANGDLSAYIGTPIDDPCGGAPMCAHSNIDFSWNGNVMPVQAAFGMTPLFPALTDLASLHLGVQFSVESLDTEPDGIKGTAMTTGPFAGFTPYFAGTATLVGINLFGSPIANPDVFVSPVPEPSEAALMLVGVGLVAGMARRGCPRRAETGAG